MCAVINPILGEIRGSIKGITGSRCRGVSVLRGKTSGVQPRTPAQTIQRSHLAGVAVEWSSLLTQIERDSWNTLAAGLTWYNRFGDPYTPTGYNVYIQVNNNRALIGDPLFTTAPANLNFTAFNIMTLAQHAGGDDTLQIVFAPVLGVNEQIVMKGAINQSLGLGRVVKDFMVIGVSAKAAISPLFFILPARMSLVAEGVRCSVQCARYNSVNGALSPWVTGTSLTFGFV